MPTYTATLNLAKPTTPTDDDVWGPLLNTNADTIDAAIAARAPTANPTFSGIATSPRFAVDANFYAALSGANPQQVFDANDYLQYTRSTNQLAGVIGGTTVLTLSATQLTMGVPVAVAADPTAALQLATKQYVDAGGTTGLLRVAAPSVASAASAVVISLPTGYDCFEILGREIRGGIESYMFARLSFDNGSTYASGGTDYYNALVYNDPAAPMGLHSQTSLLQLSGNIHTTERGVLDLKVFPGASGLRTQTLGQSFGVTSGGNRSTLVSGAECLLTGARPTHILLGMVGTTITGKFQLLGSKS